MLIMIMTRAITKRVNANYDYNKSNEKNINNRIQNTIISFHNHYVLYDLN